MSAPTPSRIEANFHAFLDAAPDAMLVVDDRGPYCPCQPPDEETFQVFGFRAAREISTASLPKRNGKQGQHQSLRWGLFNERRTTTNDRLR
jgi:hypothetical protein